MIEAAYIGLYGIESFRLGSECFTANKNIVVVNFSINEKTISIIKSHLDPHTLSFHIHKIKVNLNFKNRLQ